MKEKTEVTVITMFLIAWLDSLALLMGHNGSVLLASIGAIAGLGGYRFAKSKKNSNVILNKLINLYTKRDFSKKRKKGFNI